jgi:phage terminase small subunit
MPRRRLPDELLISKGTFRADRHGEPERKAKVELPEDWSPPQFLDEAGRAEWTRIVDLYARREIITKAHLMPLAAYCVLASKLTRTPESFTSADHAQLRGYASTFGFTPVDSDRITVKQTKDELAERFANIA